MRKKIIAGNWKMFKTITDALVLVEGLKKKVNHIDDVEIVVAPPFTALATVYQSIQASNILLAAQNMFFEKEGAYTGEISGGMLKDAGCQYVIIGHSERREYFGETDESVNKKVHAALNEGLLVIVCVGESLEQREAGKTFDHVGQQVRLGLDRCSVKEMERIVIAYEPIWAIGTGKTATPDQANEVHSAIRRQLSEMIHPDVAENSRILYGGSVKPSNTKDLMSQSDIDGSLVGGASLTVESFSEIILASC
jgi:triosephosphate isomerase